MKNLNVQEKSKGVIIFGFDTDSVDYVAIAEQAARLIHHTLRLPVTLITDQQKTNNFFDQIICIDNSLSNTRIGYANGTQWRNGNRYLAYELSPYDETILIDSDYLMLDQSLLTILETTHDYRLIHNNWNPTQCMSGDMGLLSLDYIWATAITFKRSERAKGLFDLVGRIQRNYSYYQQLYQVRRSNFRNDYAFAIANNILSGYNINKSQGVPWSMLTIDKPIKNIEIAHNKLIIREDTAHIVPIQNLHIMDKDFLQSEIFVKFIDAILCRD